MTAALSDGICKLTLPDGLHVTATDDPASPVLARFFAGYDKAFVLPDEREELEGFIACLAINRSHRHAFGRTHSEIVAVIEDDSGTMLAGTNFLATSTSCAQDGPPATIALNYVFVEAAARGRGLLRKTLDAVRQLAVGTLGLPPGRNPPAIFIEQNDPVRMSPEDYAADSAHSGTDQIDRMAIWAKVGARIVDFPYVQPPLSELQHPDDSLVYAAIGYPEDTVDAGLLRDHLESFFAISVRKGQPEGPAGVGKAQLAAMANGPRQIGLIPMEPGLARLRTQGAAGFGCFRDLAREAAR